MNKEEYDVEKAVILKHFEDSKSQLAYAFAMSNYHYKEGDIISDVNHTIKIEKIIPRFSYDSKYPECVYRGPEYLKDGSNPRMRRGAINYYDVWQSNIKTN